MVNVRNSNVDSILFIRSAEREHSGTYELVLKIENMEDRASINIRIVGMTPRTLDDLAQRHTRWCNIHQSLEAYTNKSLTPNRQAWATFECEGDWRLGLQCSTWVGPPQGWWQLWYFWIHYPEGRHEDQGEKEKWGCFQSSSAPQSPAKMSSEDLYTTQDVISLNHRSWLTLPAGTLLSYFIHVFI